jgi:DNA polymerase II small subunit
MAGDINVKIKEFLDKGFLINPDVLGVLREEGLDLEDIESVFKGGQTPLVITKDLLRISKDNKEININWLDFEKARVLYEKKRDTKVYKTFLEILNYDEKKEKFEKILDQISKPEDSDFVEEEKCEGSMVVVKQYIEEDNKEKDVSDFVYYYKARYDFLSRLLKQRPELRDVISIGRVKQKRFRDDVSLIGLVASIEKTKNKNLILTLEDPTGQVKILVNMTKHNLAEKAKFLVPDEVIGVNCVIGDGILFANDLFYPDVPFGEGVKTCDDDVYVVFTSDVHVGSKYFLEDAILRFIKWLNMDVGTQEQKEVAKKVKYLFITGDLVEGVGIYPGQYDDLVIKDIVEQYEKFAYYVGLIRKDINIIICPGNHDALRLEEPQPLLDKKIANSLFKLPNVTIVSNPALVNIHSSKDFPGFDVLLYHGFSYDYYADNIENVRLLRPNISDRAEFIMKLLLQKRHLAPTHESTLTIPNPKSDPLIIDKVPDFFVSGHVHSVSVTQYGKTTNIVSGTWISQTPYQDKFGHVSQPGKVPIVNLKTRSVKVMKFV